MVTVTGELGDSISVTFTNGIHTVTKTVTGTGSAQAVMLTASDLTTLTDGTISVSATQTDAAGNRADGGGGHHQLCARYRGAGGADAGTGHGRCQRGDGGGGDAAGGVVTVTGELGDSISVTFTNGIHTVTKTVTGTGGAQAVTLTRGRPDDADRRHHQRQRDADRCGGQRADRGGGHHQLCARYAGADGDGGDGQRCRFGDQRTDQFHGDLQRSGNGGLGQQLHGDQRHGGERHGR